MNIFFVVSNDSIPYVLDHTEKYDDNVVVTFSENAHMFFSFVNGNYLHLKAKFNPNGIYKSTGVIFNYLKALSFYSKHFDGLRNADVHFYNVGHTLILFYFLKKLSVRNRVTLHFSDKSRDDRPAPFFLNIIPRVLFGLQTNAWYHGNTFFYQLDKSFLEGINIVQRENISFPLLNIEIADGESLVICDDLPEHGWMSKKQFTKDMNRLVDFLESKNVDFLVKKHPSSPVLYGRMNDKKALPEYIPFEFLVNYPWRNIIGVLSTCLIDSAKRGLNTISVLNCIGFEEGERKKFYNWMKKESSDKITFVNSFDELGGCLNV